MQIENVSITHVIGDELSERVAVGTRLLATKSANGNAGTVDDSGSACCCTYSVRRHPGRRAATRVT